MHKCFALYAHGFKSKESAEAIYVLICLVIYGNGGKGDPCKGGRGDVGDGEKVCGQRGEYESFIECVIYKSNYTLTGEQHKYAIFATSFVPAWQDVSFSKQFSDKCQQNLRLYSTNTGWANQSV